MKTRKKRKSNRYNKTKKIKEDYNRWLFNGDYFIFSDNIPNFPPLID